MIFELCIICFLLYVILLFVARCKNNRASDEDTGIIEGIEFPYFSPFMAYYCKYKKDLSETAKIAFMTNVMESLRNNYLMRVFIRKMFDFDVEVDELERESSQFQQEWNLRLTTLT